MYRNLRIFHLYCNIMHSDYIQNFLLQELLRLLLFVCCISITEFSFTIPLGKQYFKGTVVHYISSYTSNTETMLHSFFFLYFECYKIWQFINVNEKRKFSIKTIICKEYCSMKWKTSHFLYMLLTFQSLLVTWCTNRFNIQLLYALPTLYLRVLYLSENKQWLVPLTA